VSTQFQGLARESLRLTPNFLIIDCQYAISSALRVNMQADGRTQQDQRWIPHACIVGYSGHPDNWISPIVLALQSQKGATRSRVESNILPDIWVGQPWSQY
jgi:hypothetical protein